MTTVTTRVLYCIEGPLPGERAFCCAHPRVDVTGEVRRRGLVGRNCHDLPIRSLM
ncbi:hypothetical protein [Aestuariimicrobium sp. T2.26MG-19.2B]|uniref:hypothetical protein n=1 Tax=Aestuariimicrobium sp. T2.26MG-19.2B TaxID=3040679 RepID=UPI002541997F|nr:hypothetical protein [Aestuariimicrobium sp. T2.26MG-19.2B]